MNLRFLPTLLVGTTLLALPGCNQKEIAALQQQNADLTKSRDQLTLEKTALAADKARNEESLRGSLLSKNQQVNQLNQNLGDAETDIRNKNADIQSKDADLQSKNARIADLQSALAQKDAATKALRQRVSDALLGFNAQDLQVSVKI
jgi:chemotaxis protein MotB